MLNRSILKSKRIISLSLVLMLMLSIMPLNIAQAAGMSGLGNFTKTNSYISGQFSDVSTKDWFNENVKTVYELGLMNGNSATTFNPKGNITQAEALTITARIHKIYTTGNDDFSDIKQEMIAMEPEILAWCNNDKNSPAYKEFYNAWYAPYAYYLYAYVWGEGRGIYPQFPALAFSPAYAPFIDTKEPLIRGRVISELLVGAIPENEFDQINNIPNDAIPDVSYEYDSNIYLFYRAGILTGNDVSGTFSFNSNITRAEVAAIIGRMVNKTQRKSFVLQEKTFVPQSVTLAGATTITVGETTQWKATVEPSNANQWVQWVSGNPGVATIDANGNITAHKAGQSNITAITSNGIKKTVLITVKSNMTENTMKLQQMAALGIDTAYNSAKFPSTLCLNTVTYEDMVNGHGDSITRMVLRCYASNSLGGYGDIYVVVICCDHEADYLDFEWDGLYFSASAYDSSPGMCSYTLDNEDAMNAYKSLINNPKEIPFD